jgi:hypothetical protein
MQGIAALSHPRRPVLAQPNPLTLWSVPWATGGFRHVEALCRAEGRRRLYRLEPARLRPLHDWLAGYERALNDRLDRLDDYLEDLQRRERAR